VVVVDEVLVEVLEAVLLDVVLLDVVLPGAVVVVLLVLVVGRLDVIELVVVVPPPGVVVVVMDDDDVVEPGVLVVVVGVDDVVLLSLTMEVVLLPPPPMEVVVLSAVDVVVLEMADVVVVVGQGLVGDGHSGRFLQYDAPKMAATSTKSSVTLIQAGEDPRRGGVCPTRSRIWPSVLLIAPGFPTARIIPQVIAPAFGAACSGDHGTVRFGAGNSWPVARTALAGGTL
jgi:hypothetical protein